MKLLYILKEEPDKTLKEIMDAQRSEHDVIQVSMGEDRNYDQLVEQIEECDKVMCW